jgi:hypothetical protein
MKIIGSRELEEMDQQAINLETPDKELSDASISSYIMGCWEQAKRYKENGAEPQILKNMRQIDGEYEADKLRAIKEVGGSEIFMMITDAKSKNATSWVCDILFQASSKPWAITPTPVPELPAHIKDEIFGQLMSQLVQTMAMQNPELLQDPDAIQQVAQQMMPEMEKQVAVEIVTIAKKMAEEIEKKVDDKLIEGGWYAALKETVTNVVLHTGILKGPVYRKRFLNKIVTTPSGKLESVVKEDVIPTYETRHPLFIYPAPGSTGIDDGYLIDRIKITPMKLQELIGVQGYKDEEILEVISESTQGKYNNWLGLQVDQDIADMNSELAPMAYDSDKIDCLEFWGYVYGDKLLDWGLTTDKDKQPIDENKFYNICAYLIGNHVIKIQFNKDPMGRKPYYKASFEERAGSFWGKGLPEIIVDCQTACNAVARAIANNAGMASGPQIERNIDRITAADRADNQLVPWKVWDVTDSMMMSNAPALKFYQPPMVVERLMSVYTSFSKIADEHSGVPAYAHGDPQVGGAGNTASGLSMLMSSAARGIKALVTSIDDHITSQSVKRQYQLCIEQEENYGLVCDYEVVTIGSTAALLKEQLSARRMEFMAGTNNPVDLQIMGFEGRKYLLEETARSMQLDVTRIFPPQQPPQPQNTGGQPGQPMPGQVPPEASQTLDASGNPVVGQDTRQFNQGAVQTPAGIPGRAEGGRVSPPGSTPTPSDPNPGMYEVGEMGRELFVPDRPGTIIPNQQTQQTQPTGMYGGSQLPIQPQRSEEFPVPKLTDLTGQPEVEDPSHRDLENHDIIRILSQNVDKNFVQRLVNPQNYPVVERPDLGPGGYSTHLMSYAPTRDGAIVYPNIVQDPHTGKLVQLDPKAAMDYAMQTGEHIHFPNPKDAAFFAENYKKPLGIK